MTKTRSGRSGTGYVRAARAHGETRTRMRPHARAPRGHIRIQLPYKSGFRHTFRKLVPRTKKSPRKTTPAILYNLREKSGPKIKNKQSYSKSTAQFPLVAILPCTAAAVRCPSAVTCDELPAQLC
jgi:hypothetical protein